MKLHPNAQKPVLLPTNTQCRSGFASILTVVSVGIGLLLILLSMYNDTVESQSTQKDHMLRADYQQREEAFLRALTNIIPNKAILCMQDDSFDGATRDSLRWQQIYDEALILSNSDEALSPDRAAALGVTQLRTANTANTTLSSASIISLPFGDASQDISAGINLTAGTDYPPPLTLANNASREITYPIVSMVKQYGSSTI